jgi:hypothetical protein
LSPFRNNGLLGPAADQPNIVAIVGPSVCRIEWPQHIIIVSKKEMNVPSKI